MTGISELRLSFSARPAVLLQVGVHSLKLSVINSLLNFERRSYYPSSSLHPVVLVSDQDIVFAKVRDEGAFARACHADDRNNSIGRSIGHVSKVTWRVLGQRNLQELDGIGRFCDLYILTFCNEVAPCRFCSLFSLLCSSGLFLALLSLLFLALFSLGFLLFMTARFFLYPFVSTSFGFNVFQFPLFFSCLSLLFSTSFGSFRLSLDLPNGLHGFVFFLSCSIFGLLLPLA